MTETPTPGQLLRLAREAHHLSVRAAAKRAGVSEGLWRQVEAGVRRVAEGVEIPVNNRANTLKAMASAVGADVEQVLRAGGHEVTAEDRAPSFHLSEPDLAARVERMSPQVRALWQRLAARIADELLTTGSLTISDELLPFTTESGPAFLVGADGSQVTNVQVEQAARQLQAALHLLGSETRRSVR